jgi:hypothetical protein
MALTDREERQVTVLVDGRLQVRVDTIIERDGEEISRTFHRKVIDVGGDVTDQPQLIKDIAGVVHTEERIAARAALIAGGA